MSLREQASKFRNGLRVKALFYNKIFAEEILKRSFTEKEHMFRTFLRKLPDLLQQKTEYELQKNILMLFMQLTRSKKGYLQLYQADQKKNSNSVQAGYDSFDTARVDSKKLKQSILQIFDESGKEELIIPILKSKQNTGFIALAETELISFKPFIEILEQTTALIPSLLEKPMGQSGNIAKNNEIFAINEIGRIISSVASFEEMLFLSVTALENGLGVKKFLLLLKSKKNEFHCVEGFGLRENSLKKFKFSQNSALAELLAKNESPELKQSDFPFHELLDADDLKEMNTTLFFPMKLFGEIEGYFVVFAFKELGNLEQKKKLCQVLAYYFTYAIFLYRKNPLLDENDDFRKNLLRILNEQLDFSRKMEISLGFFITLSPDKKIYENLITDCNIIPLLFNHTLIISPFEKKEEYTRAVAELKQRKLLHSTFYSDDYKSSEDLLNILNVL